MAKAKRLATGSFALPVSRFAQGMLGDEGRGAHRFRFDGRFEAGQRQGLDRQVRQDGPGMEDVESRRLVARHVAPETGIGDDGQSAGYGQPAGAHFRGPTLQFRDGKGAFYQHEIESLAAFRRPLRPALRRFRQGLGGHFQGRDRPDDQGVREERFPQQTRFEPAGFQAEGDPLRHHAVRVELGIVEDGVEYGKQGIGAGSDRVELFALVRRKIHLRQDFGAAHDAVHGRADFVVIQRFLEPGRSPAQPFAIGVTLRIGSAAGMGLGLPVFHRLFQHADDLFHVDASRSLSRQSNAPARRLFTAAESPPLPVVITMGMFPSPGKRSRAVPSPSW